MTQMIDTTVMPDVWSAVWSDLQKNHVRGAVAHDLKVRVQQVVGTPLITVKTQVWYPTEDELRDTHDHHK